MTVLLLGANHDTATVAVRECLSIPADRIAEALRFLSSSIGEIVLISTCNRTEFYALDPKTSEPALRRFLYQHAGLEPGEIDHALYRMEGDEAIRHLLRVSSGLDSMILGEPQILGQVREAWKIAQDARSLGPVLDTLFRTALQTGKQARARTGISRGALSVSQAAVEFARERLGSLRDRTVLVVGAGETGALVARNLRSNGAGQVIVANRTIERATELASELHADAVAFDDLAQAIRNTDILISCTGAVEPVITADLVAPAMTSRAERPLLAIDIAVPRDIAADVGDVPGVALHDLDSIQARIDLNTEGRREQAQLVEETVEAQTRQFLAWYNGHIAGPTIRAARAHADQIREEQLQRALKRMPDLDDAERETLRIFSEQLVNALLHRPIRELRDPEAGPHNADALRTLFDLDVSVEPDDDEQDPNARTVA